jgi:hypothetical protein
VCPSGPFQLVVPETAGYYIAAYEAEMARTKRATLRFATVEERDRALVLLNSNVYFWYWRVVGDGFDVTKGIVEACPWVGRWDAQANRIAQQLARAASACTVHKGYRGKQVPNVNYNLRLDLIWQADEWVIRSIAPDLGLTPVDFVWAKSNSFLRLEVPKSAHWPPGFEQVEARGQARGGEDDGDE